jgi:hypothetical protein
VNKRLAVKVEQQAAELRNIHLPYDFASIHTFTQFDAPVGFSGGRPWLKIAGSPIKLVGL